MEKQPISTRFHASSSLAGGTRFGGVAQWQSSGLLDQRAQVRPLPPPQISSFRRGGFHARFYESRCPGSTPGGRTTSPSSSWPRTPASHVGNGVSNTPGDATASRRRHSLALVLPDAGARLLSGTRWVRLPARALDHDDTMFFAAMVQQQNTRVPTSRSGCDSRWPLRCDPRRKVGLISPIKVVRLHPQQDAELVIW